MSSRTRKEDEKEEEEEEEEEEKSKYERGTHRDIPAVREETRLLRKRDLACAGGRDGCVEGLPRPGRAGGLRATVRCILLAVACAHWSTAMQDSMSADDTRR